MWLILIALCAFSSVSYLDCDHTTYQSVIEDRPHMEQRTGMQSERMLFTLGVGVFVYALGLSVALVIVRPSRGVAAGGAVESNDESQPP